MDAPRTLHVVIFLGERYWVAQCLEIDIATQGSDFNQLAERFERALQAHIETSRERDADPFTCLPPAPDRHWDKWPEVKAQRERQQALDIESRWRWNLSLGFPVTVEARPLAFA
jgi:hypothetical protein